MISDDRDVEPKGKYLEGKSIDVVVSGGVAAIETPKLIRELRRFGANVRVFMTEAATKFVSPLVFEWASKNPVITDLSGSAEHITRSDGVIVAPATLDFLSKIALGLSDSAAATLVQSAISRLPVLFAPSMHLSLKGNPAFERNLNLLREINKVVVLSPSEAEGKAKMMDFESMAAEVCHHLSESPLKNLPILISLGPTRAYADDMRYLSNRSTGALGIAIADNLYRRGAQVFSVCGVVQRSVPSYLNPIFVETNIQMKEAFKSVLEKQNPRIGIFCAAVLDFDISNPASGKFSSKESWKLDLKPSPKLIQSVAATSEMIRVGFKLESKISVEDLKDRAKKSAKENSCKIVVANRLEDVSAVDHKAYLYFAKEDIFLEASTKHEIAEILSDNLEKMI